MKALFLAVILLVTACSGGTTQTVRQAVAGVATIYATADIAFRAYASLPRCSATVPQPCSEAARVVQIGTSLLAAHDAVNLARHVANSLSDDIAVDRLSAEQKAALAGALAAVSSVNLQITGAVR